MADSEHEEEEEVGPSVDSNDPEERIKARRIRIQNRVQAKRRFESFTFRVLFVVDISLLALYTSGKYLLFKSLDVLFLRATIVFQKLSLKSKMPNMMQRLFNIGLR